MMTMGGDFQYENAVMWFKNLDKLIKYVNAAVRRCRFWFDYQIGTGQVVIAMFLFRTTEIQQLSHVSYLSYEGIIGR